MLNIFGINVERTEECLSFFTDMCNYKHAHFCQYLSLRKKNLKKNKTKILERKYCINCFFCISLYFRKRNCPSSTEILHPNQSKKR